MATVKPTETYALDLHYIKALCVAKQYRSCIQTCRNVLKKADKTAKQSPLQQTFISFYLGLAHDQLARLMLDDSHAKLPAFAQAADFYKQALESLPSADDHVPPNEISSRVQEDDPFYDHSTSPQSPESEYDPYCYSSPSLPASPVSPPPTSDLSDLPSRSPPTSVMADSNSNSTLTSLESHSSFDQIMTPHRVLERDFSRVSLIDHSELPKRSTQTSLPRTTSTTQGLLRPIRPGDTPVAFHVPPKLPYVGAKQLRNVSLPMLMTQESPSRRRWDYGFQDDGRSPVSPVSPLGHHFVASDTSTISPVSPSTLTETEELDTPLAMSRSADSDEEDMQTVADHHRRIADHISAFRTQLHTHLALLEQARHRAQLAQSTKHRTAPPTTGTPLPPLRASIGSERPDSIGSKHDSVFSAQESKRGVSISSTRSLAMQKRIQEGRDRGWRRERWDGERYRVLREKALAEL